jgi:catechol 2,3-dioxygenase-like lactoylglutathione lyase family enzyme
VAESIFKHQGRIGNSTRLDTLANPALKHVGVLVRDLEATTKELSRIFGVDSWQTFDFTPPQTAVMVGKAFSVKVANASILGLPFHIFAPVEDVDTFADSHPVWGKWLQRSFGGIQHICVSVDNWDEVVRQVMENGGQAYKNFVSPEGRRIAHIEGEIGLMAMALEERKPADTREKTAAVSNLKGKMGSSKHLDAMANPSLQHLGIFVRDRTSYMRYVSKVWGVDDWETLEFIPAQEDMMAGNSVRLGMANTNLLRLLLHVSERLDDADTFARMSSVWSEWERTRGEGHYHLYFSVDNWEKVVETVRSGGAQLFASSAYEGRRWAHFICPVTFIDIEIEERPAN